MEREKSSRPASGGVQGQVGAEGQGTFPGGRRGVDGDDRAGPDRPQRLHTVGAEAPDAPDADGLGRACVGGDGDRGTWDYRVRRSASGVSAARSG